MRLLISRLDAGLTCLEHLDPVTRGIVSEGSHPEDTEDSGALDLATLSPSSKFMIC